MAFQCKGHFIRAHPATVIGDFEAGQTAVNKRHCDSRSARINRVFNQLFEGCRRSFNHFASGNTVNERFRKATDLGHLSQASALRAQFRVSRGKIRSTLNKKFSLFASVSLGGMGNSLGRGLWGADR